MMRLVCSMALQCLLGSLPCRAQQVSIESLKADTDYVVSDSILIPSSDGVLISALMLRKREMPEPLPVIFQFTIYARHTDIQKLKIAVDHGYVGVMAYTRGKRYSTGVDVYAYEHDGQDAWQVIDWISKQDWCNGKVGMMGGSYNGFTQWAAAKKLHPALKTIVPSASAAPGIDVPIMNNVFMSFPFSWTYYVSNNAFLDEEDYRDPKWTSVQKHWFQLGTAYPELDSLLGKPSPMFHRWLAHPTYDAYWQSMIPYKEDFAKIDIPVLTTTGYYDGGQIGALYYMREHLKYNPNAEHYLLIGPYGHFGSQGRPDTVLGGYRVDPVALVPIHSLIYEWFDYVLKGAARPDFLKDRINFQPMGTNEWKQVPSLEKVATDTVRFYLDDRHAGLLNSKKPRKGRSRVLEVDFTDRSSFQSYYYVSQLIYDSLFSAGGLMYKSTVLRSPIDLAGHLMGNMHVTINKKDMDYSVALFEEMPDGRYLYLSVFMGRASYAHSNQQRLLLHPGVSTWLSFSNSYFCSRRLGVGSRLVVIVNINKSPFEQINYGSGKEVNEETIRDAGEPLRIKWHNDSFIELPVRRDAMHGVSTG